jgi:hypothetical protein
LEINGKKLFESNLILGFSVEKILKKKYSSKNKYSSKKNSSHKKLAELDQTKGGKPHEHSAS